jgi:hypothetical protein
MYVIKRVEDNAYVAPPGSPRSYTPNIAKARVWHKREEAERERCGNEIIVTVEAELAGLRPR